MRRVPNEPDGFDVDAIARERVNGATDEELLAEQFGTNVRKERFPGEDELLHDERYFPRELGGGPLNLSDDRCPECGGAPNGCAAWCELGRLDR